MMIFLVSSDMVCDKVWFSAWALVSWIMDFMTHLVRDC